MSIAAKDAVAIIQGWFDQLPDQNKARSLMLELPGGRNAPNADGFIVPLRIATEGDEIIIDLDTPMQLRFRRITNVHPASGAELRLDFDELNVAWGGEEHQTAQYHNENARFVSGHLVDTQSDDKPAQGITWENPI